MHPRNSSGKKVSIQRCRLFPQLRPGTHITPSPFPPESPAASPANTLADPLRTTLSHELVLVGLWGHPARARSRAQWMAIVPRVILPKRRQAMAEQGGVCVWGECVGTTVSGPPSSPHPARPLFDRRLILLRALLGLSTRLLLRIARGVANTMIYPPCPICVGLPSAPVSRCGSTAKADNPWICLTRVPVYKS